LNKVGGVIWKCKRNELVCLIRSVGVMWGEDEEFLDDYIVEQVAAWSNSIERLDEAISCFGQLKIDGVKK